MSRRSLSTLLVVMVALWGVGLPRFVHMMTAHAPGSATLISHADATSNVRCTSKCCSLHAHASTANSTLDDVQSNDEHTHHSDCDESHHCNICDLLATLLTSVPALPIVSLAWEPIVEYVADSTCVSLVTVETAIPPVRGPPVLL